MSLSTWWQTSTTLKKVRVVALTITAVIGALVAVGGVMQAGEAYWPATRGHVTEKIEQSTGRIMSRMLDTQIVVENGERRRIEDKIADRELLLRSNPNLTDQMRAIIDEQLREWRRELSQANNRIDDLNRERSGRRP